MDKNLKSFAVLSAVAIVCLLLILAGFGCIYRYSTINTYGRALLFMMLLTIIVILLFVFSAVVVLHTYRTRRISGAGLWLIKLSLNVFIPLTIYLAGILKNAAGKENARNFFISVNNILAESGRKGYSPEDILVLLPHCLQNSECGYKITNDISKCRRCGKCCIGDILETSERAGVELAVVTGGTAARNIILNNRFKIILSVACERDLVSGISEVWGIPVIGIVNQRPNGPCRNTVVDVGVVRQKLDNILAG